MDNKKTKILLSIIGAFFSAIPLGVLFMGDLMDGKTYLAFILTTYAFNMVILNGVVWNLATK